MVWYGGLFELIALLLTTELPSSSSFFSESDCWLELLQSVLELVPTEEEEDPCEVAARLEQSVTLPELDRKNVEEAVESDDEWM